MRAVALAVGMAALLLGCGGETCVRAIECVEDCGGPIVATACTCPAGTFDRLSCGDAATGSLESVELVEVRGGGADTSGNEELCVVLRAGEEIVLDQVRFLTASWPGPITIGAEPVELCARGCWCFAPSGNEVIVVRGSEERRIAGPSGACCG